MKPNAITRDGTFVGGYLPGGLKVAIEQWVKAAPERDNSKFLRQAIREKLANEGIPFTESSGESV